MNLEGHGSEWEQSEKPTIEQLVQMGYEYKTNKELNLNRESFNEPLLLDRLEDAIKRLNPWIDDYGVEDAIRQIRKFDTSIQIDANEIAHAKIIGLSRGNLEPITVKQDLGDGTKPHTVKIIDFEPENISNNDFLVTNQFWVWGHKDYIYPDVMIFVNGIPFVVIECKSPFVSNPINEAIHNNLARYQDRNTGFEKLFYYNQILVATCGTQAKYATTYSDAHHYREWVDPYPLTNETVEVKFGKARKQEILIAGMFEKYHLLDLIHNFTVYETNNNKRIKKIAKYQQFRAVNKTISRIESGKSPQQKGGVIWHTQGSGKSLTMLWLALKLKRKFGNPTVLIVTDRRQLDKQITDTFRACGFPNPEQASNSSNLKDMLENNKGKTIMTTIQKFLFRDEEPHKISDDSCFILVDEGHRSQYGATNADMRIALPNGIFFAYTGTPLMKDDKTKQFFGDYIDKYKLSQSEADGATIPIYYESRLTDIQVEGESVNKAFDRITKDVDEDTKDLAKRKFANNTAIASAPDRIKKICLDILDHYENVVKPNGFKAMIVAPSRLAAAIYKEELDKLNAPESRVIITEDPKDKISGLEKYQLSKSDRERYAERFKLSLQEEGLSILIVVDMLLTGFDAPILQVLYLDHGLREHNLLQAIARVNRPYGTTKTHGLIVDYWGISKNLKDAFELYDDSDIQESLKPLDDAKQQLKLRHAKVMGHFKEVDHDNLDQVIELLLPEDKREEFEHDFRQFSKFMEMVLPDPEATKYRQDLKFLSKTRAAARTAFIDENLVLRDIGAKVKKLIEESIRASETIQLIAPTKIDNKNFMKLVDSYGSNKTRASIIEKKARKVIEDNESKNPEYYMSLKIKLETIIDELRNKKYDDANKFNELQDLIQELFKGENKWKELGFDIKVQFSIFSTLEKIVDSNAAKKITFEIYDSLKTHKVIEWRKKDNIKKEMRAAIKDILYSHELDDDKVQKLAVELVDLSVTNSD
jgi:type I restriction enzyme, R subunit